MIEFPCSLLNITVYNHFNYCSSQETEQSSSLVIFRLWYAKSQYVLNQSTQGVVSTSIRRRIDVL